MEQPIFWYCRTIFTVANLEDAVNFYTQKLQFEEQWRKEDTVSQVNLNGVEIILSCDKKIPISGGRILVVLNQESIMELRDTLQSRDVNFSFVNDPWFALKIKDIDGNEIWFQDQDR